MAPVGVQGGKVQLAQGSGFGLPRLNGHAKAMGVVGSRLEAVRWKLALDGDITEKCYSKACALSAGH